MNLEDLEKKLYRQNRDAKTEIIENNKNETSEEIPNETFLGAAWQEKNEKEYSDLRAKKTDDYKTVSPNRAKLIISATLILSIAIISTAGFYLYNLISANQEVNFLVSAPKNVLSGSPFNLKINFANGSKNTLKNAALSVFLPENAIVVGEEKNKRVFVKQIGDLEIGANLSEEISLAIFSNNETIKNFDVVINYASGKNGKFEQKQNIEIIIKESAVKLDFVAPEKILNNEKFEILADYSNISEYDFKKIKLSFDYPKNFTFVKSDPVLQNNSLETNLPKNKEGKISITGFAIGQEQSFIEIKIKAEAFYNGNWRQINEKSAKLKFAESPLSFKIESNAADYAFPNDLLTYRLAYYNNSDIGLSDAVIKTKLTGEMLDLLSLKTDGAFDSRDNSIVWNAVNSPELKLISPKNGGSVKFELNLKPSYPTRKISDKNFIVSIAAEISSPTIPYYTAADKTISLANLTTKIGGKILIETKAYFREPTFKIFNNGTLPPKANAKTNFTIHWLIKNYATDAKNIIVKTSLPQGVKFTGTTKSNISSAPAYNDKTGEAVWMIDKIPATKGVISKPVEAAFQIEAIPNIIMIGDYMSLISRTLLTATDEFIGAELKNSSEEITTYNLNDIGFDSKSGIVIQ